MKNNEKLLDLIGDADESMVPEVKIKNNEAYLMNQEEDKDMKENASVFIADNNKKNRKFNWSALGGGLCAAAVLGFAIFGGWKIYEINNDIYNSSTDAPDISDVPDITDNSQGSGNAVTPPDPSASQTEDVSKPEPDAVYPPVLDSGAVYERYGGGELDEILTLGYCCVIPYGTPVDEMEESIQRLYTGGSTYHRDSTWNGLEVISASSNYNPSFTVHAQSLRLSGNITLSGKAEYLMAPDGTTIAGIEIWLDEESLEKLPILTPKYFSNADAFSQYYDEQYVSEVIRFALNEYSDENYTPDEYYAKIADVLDAKGEATVTVTTDDFILQYTDFGLITDGRTLGLFNNIINLTVE